jgi:hypothetical protein
MASADAVGVQINKIAQMEKTRYAVPAALRSRFGGGVDCRLVWLQKPRHALPAARAGVTQIGLCVLR